MVGIPKLGTLSEIEDLRSVWRDEAKDFTPWLADDENIGILSDALGLDLAVEERESSVGSFSADILATDIQSGGTVVIENQLEETDHRHLGQIITYASGKGASVVVWIVKRAREEHRSAVEWLNEHTDDGLSFFLCELKLYRIGASDMAPMFDVVERPNGWAREQHRAAKSFSATQQERKKWWEAFNERGDGNPEFARAFRKRKASTDHWMSLYLRSSLCHIQILQERQRSQLGVEIYISDNKDFYRFLHGHKAEVDAAFGAPMEWMELPDKKASRVAGFRDLDYTDAAAMPGAFDWAIEKSLSLRAVLKPLLREFKDGVR